ncbi:TPA: copper homeostasis membrane protein CopD [Klebsiella pneumoniae]
MLTGLYITLRFGHFISLMLAFGCVLYGAWWAPVPLRRVLMLHFYPLLRPLLLIGAISTLALYLLQGGMMGEGWTDVWRPAVWQAVAGTRFGGVWIWQILLAWIALAVVWIRPRHGARQLVALLAAQLLLSAGVGHAAMHDGLTGVLQRTNHAVHLFCVASWFGGLLPFIYCLCLAQGRWRPAAVYTMARFSRYGHLAVAGTIASGALNALLIQGGLIGASPWGRMLLIKCALVAGMVVIALVNRYVLVPRMSASGSQAESLILRTTQAEIGLGALALLAVSLFATWEPY